MARTKFLASLFSLFGLAPSLLILSTDALATHCGLRLPCYHLSGSTTSTGSEVMGDIRIGDAVLSLEQTVNPSYFNVHASTSPEQNFDCEYTNNAGVSQPAKCSYPEVSGVPGISCNLFLKGSCNQTTLVRESTMSCETPSAGCTGTITVKDLNGVVLEVMQIGVGLPTGSTSCQSEFPRTTGSDALARGIMGKITQVCSGATDADVTNDPISKIVVRTDLRDEPGSKQPKYSSAGTAPWEANEANCDPVDGFPIGSCQNSGVVQVTVLQLPAGADANACATAAAQKLACGVKADGSAGPAPSSCTVTAAGECKCTCPRCEENVGSLVNAGSFGNGHFTLWDPKGEATGKPWTATCEVTVTGN